MTTENFSDPTAKIAIVTGGSRGLGRNTVLHLAKRGVRSIFTYHSNRAEADKVVTAVSEAGGTAVSLPLDTGKVNSFDAFVKEVTNALASMGTDRFDFLVNNAGTSHHAPFDQVTEEDFDSLYHVHFKGVFFLTQKLLPLPADPQRQRYLAKQCSPVIRPLRSRCGQRKSDSAWQFYARGAARCF